MLVGETTRLFPVPTSVPPHEEVYHFIVAPWPPPPVKVKVVLPEPHIVVTLAVADVGATEAGVTVTVAVALFAAAQAPLVTTALYEVVAAKLVAVNVSVVLAIGVPDVAKLSKDDSQRVTDPV